MKFTEERLEQAFISTNHNIYKFVNQLEIVGTEKRIPARLQISGIVGMTRFERATTRPPDVYSTGLSYIPPIISGAKIQKIHELQANIKIIAYLCPKNNK